MSEEEDKPAAVIPHRQSLIARIRRALRGDIDARTVALEALRRSRAAARGRRERAEMDLLDKRPARLLKSFKSMRAGELLEHFQTRGAPKSLPGLNAGASGIVDAQRKLFPQETKRLIEAAARVRDEHCWRLLGFGEKCFGSEIEWRRDPVSGFKWPLQYHADISFQSRGDGSDVRVLWELNRFNHFITMARAYVVTCDETFVGEFFRQLEGWRRQNPVGRGANWSCAMEVALRSVNLLAAFELFRRSKALTEERLMMLLDTLDQHGAHIRRNLEFSYIGTSNHYLSDVVGLLWLGVMMPELEAAREWREFGLREMLREMDVQVLRDGADFEASTGYHRFVLELFLYSFILCRENGIEIEERYWQKLRRMIEYVRAYLRPDGRAPLIGDSDSGQVLPITHRAADDHAYILAIGASIFKEPRFKQANAVLAEELLWILGEAGVGEYERLQSDEEGATSLGFHDAGSYLMRDRDLYLFFNASGNGVRGRGSHGHNDALSLEVSACGVSFIVDPGTYVYTADLHERQQFRSVRWHSTVEVDETEQNSTDARTPFVMGDEARPRVIKWETGAERDVIVAEHHGYKRLPQAVTHRRAVQFDKRQRFFIVEDTLAGEGSHLFSFRFHLSHALLVSVRHDKIVEACDKINGARLFIAPLTMTVEPLLEERFVSNDYGAKRESTCASWTTRAALPFEARWAIVPVCADDDETERLDLITRLQLVKPFI